MGAEARGRAGGRVAHLAAGFGVERRAVEDEFNGQTQALDRAMAALGIHQPATIGVHQLTETFCAAADVHVLAYDAVLPDAAGGVRIEVGRVSPPPPDGFAPAGTDALDVRMLLLGRAYGMPVTVTSSVLAEARRTLTHWRQQVAE